MLSIDDAKKKLLWEVTAVSAIERGVVYRNVYLFKVKYHDPDENQYDPFFSVDQKTGEIKEFSFLHDGDPREITMLFLAAEPDD